MKKYIFSIITFVIVTLCNAQKKQTVNSSNVDPYTLVTKVLKYTDRNSFSGVSKVGNASGDSFFDFSKWSKQFPNVIVSYTAFGRSAREGGVLRNFRYNNTGNFNTKIILADWQNFDKNSGSGTFELSVLNDDFPNKFYIGIQGYNWSYYFNIELSDENFQELINLLTISGKARDFIKEKYDKIEIENLKKKSDLRDKYVQDSLFKDRIEKEKIFKRNQELELQNSNQKIRLEKEKQKKYFDSVASVTINNGLVAYYPFSGNANDSSGVDNHGIVYGASLVAGKNGISNTAYLFNGINDKIILSKPFLGGGQTNVFTFSSRINVFNTLNSPNIWGKALDWGEVNFQINSDNSIHFWWSNSFSGLKYSNIQSVGNLIKPNKWYDIVIVFSNSKGLIYINGEPVDTNLKWISQNGATLSNSIVDQFCNFRIKKNKSIIGSRIVSGGNTAFFQGMIDDFRIYNRILSHEEIKYLSTL